jgi:hypothetical protein
LLRATNFSSLSVKTDPAFRFNVSATFSGSGARCGSFSGFVGGGALLK